MPFFTATQAVSSVLRAGALGFAERVIAAGWDVSRVMAALRSRYPSIEGGPFANQVYAAVVNRAEAALISGATLQRRRSDRPLDADEYTGMPGLESAYRYTVVGRFRDPDTGREFTRPFLVGTDVSSGKYEVLNIARTMANEWAFGGPTLPSVSGHEAPQLLGLRISDALIRI